MRLHRKMAALLGSSLALFVWGCTGDQVEDGADATARGLDKGGMVIESAGKAAGHKITDAGAGTKLEGAAKVTGNALETGGEKTHEILDKAGDKLKDVAPSVGKAVDKAGEKIKDLESKAGDKLKDAGAKIKEGAKDLGQKVKEEVKDLKDKASKALDKDKAPATDKNINQRLERPKTWRPPASVDASRASAERARAASLSSQLAWSLEQPTGVMHGWRTRAMLDGKGRQTQRWHVQSCQLATRRGDGRWTEPERRPRTGCFVLSARGNSRVTRTRKLRRRLRAARIVGPCYPTGTAQVSLLGPRPVRL